MIKSRKFAALILITLIFSIFGGRVMAQDEDDDEPHGMYLEKQRVFYGGLVFGGNFASIDGGFFAG